MIRSAPRASTRPFLLLAALLAVELALAAGQPHSRQPSPGLAAKSEGALVQPPVEVAAINKIYIPLASSVLTVPPMVTSWYVDTIDTNTHYGLGCTLGQRDLSLPGVQNSIVVLDFGRPKQQGNEFGTSLFSLNFANSLQIATAGQYFIQGYWECSGSDKASHLTLALGTTSFGTQVTYQHGAAWAGMVNLVGDWLNDSGIASQVTIAGANDIELAWNSPTTTRAWIDGYNSANDWRYWDYGAAEGCPPYGDCGTSAYPEWTVEDAWYKAWGASPAWPLPEIYLTQGQNAQQWYRLSLYGYTDHGLRLDFGGALTQYQACQQRGGCNQVDNTPAQGWTQLWNVLNADSRTAQALAWSADIKWLDATAGLPAEAGLPMPPAPSAAASAALLEAALASPLPDETRQSLEEKLEIVQREAQAQAQAQALGVEKPQAGLPQAPSPAADVARPTGIIEDEPGPFSAQEFIAENAWQDQIKGDWVQVYAGGLAQDPAQGLVIVLVRTPQGLIGSQHLTPVKDGALRIISAVGTRLTLQSASSAQYIFDASTQQFVTP